MDQSPSSTSSDTVPLNRITANARVGLDAVTQHLGDVAFESGRNESAAPENEIDSVEFELPQEQAEASRRTPLR
ncbi:MAG: hypothetical protein M3463_08005, partial [Verrucomicrobiota bacterium]|nr:hypothetical protein [Verrucomicrobiota bacterium]